MNLFVLLSIFTATSLSQSLNNRSSSCDQPIITSGQAGLYFCSPLFASVADSLGLGLPLGPCEDTCTALACSLSAMGCGPEAADVLERRRNAGCEDTSACGGAVGGALDEETCAKWSRLLLPVPPGGFSFSAVIDFGSDWWATQLAICNDDTAIDLASGLVDLGPVQPAIDWLADKQGECSPYCREPLCGISLLGCASHASIIEGELASRGPTCPTDLQCVAYQTPPPTVPSCSTVTCSPVPNCPTTDQPWLQPTKVENPTTDEERCCATLCTDPCVDAPCRASEPTAEACAAASPADVPPYFVVRNPPSACCQSCFDPCAETTCEPVGTCEPPLIPHRPATDCCIGCFPPCATVTCGPVDADACRAAGSTFIAGCVGNDCANVGECCDRCVSPADSSTADGEGLDDDDMLLIVVAAIGGYLFYSSCCLCLFVSTRYVRARRSPSSSSAKRRSRAGSKAPGRSRRTSREAFSYRGGGVGGGGTIPRRPVQSILRPPPPAAPPQHHHVHHHSPPPPAPQEETGFYQPVPSGPQSPTTPSAPGASYTDVGRYFS